MEGFHWIVQSEFNMREDTFKRVIDAWYCVYIFKVDMTCERVCFNRAVRAGIVFG